MRLTRHNAAPGYRSNRAQLEARRYAILERIEKYQRYRPHRSLKELIAQACGEVENASSNG